MRRTIIALVLTATPAALHAQNMMLPQFLAKAEGLEKKGALAMFSGDLRLLKGEVQNSGKALRAEQQAALKSGRKSPYCMPEKVSVNPHEVLAHFRSIPPPKRNITVKAAFADLVRKKYPCPA